MGLFDKLKKASDKIFDGLSNDAANQITKKAESAKLPPDVIKQTERMELEAEKFRAFLKYGGLTPAQKEREKKEREERKLVLQKEKEKEKEKKLLLKEKEKEIYEKRKVEFIEKYGDEIGKKIAKKELFVGMTLEMLKDVKGKHSEKVENVTNGKTKVKLYYEKSKNRLGNIAYGFEVSLEDGFVVGWKDRKNKGTKEG
ncbi:MAG: hypothetical protein K9I82_17205 [Chitinophagaceae bacterium]|nr:hypothetical protein [Chitinophagaceae bacterium]